MIEIIPAVLAKDILEIERQIIQVKDYVKIVQLDICDGRYVPTQTWPENGRDQKYLRSIEDQEDGLPFWKNVNYELDLMVKNAHKRFDEWLIFGPSRIIFHLGAEDESFLPWIENLDIFYKEQIEIGIAINTNAEIEALAPYIPHVAFVQCMGIEKIGHQGQNSDIRVHAQLEKLRELYPELILSVDGAVSFDNIQALAISGANRMVVGSTIFKSLSPEKTILELGEFVEDIV